MFISVQGMNADGMVVAEVLKPNGEVVIKCDPQPFKELKERAERTGWKFIWPVLRED